MNIESEKGAVYKPLLINYSNTILDSETLLFGYDIYWAIAKLLRTHIKK